MLHSGSAVCHNYRGKKSILTKIISQNVKQNFIKYTDQTLIRGNETKILQFNLRQINLHILFVQLRFEWHSSVHKLFLNIANNATSFSLVLYQTESPASTLPCKSPLTPHLFPYVLMSVSEIWVVFFVFSVFVMRASATQRSGPNWTNFFCFFSSSWQNWRLPETAIVSQQLPYYLTHLGFERHFFSANCF